MGDSNRIARVANNLGAVHWGLSNYNEALDLYQIALKIRRQENNARGVSLISNNIGLIYQEWELIDEALQYHEEALKYAKEINNLFARAYSYNNLGRCYEFKKDYEKALTYYQLSYNDYLESESDGSAISLALKNIGDIYYKLNRYNEAISYYQKSLQHAEEVNNQFRSAIAEYNLGKTHAKLNQFETAHQFVVKSLNKARDSGYNDLIRDNQYILSEIEEERGNIHEALEYFKNASAMNDNIFNTEKIVKFTELQIKYHLEHQTQENAILRKNNEIQRLKIKRQQFIRNSFIFGSICILVILGLIINRGSILKKSNIQLEEQNTNIRKINTDKEELIKDLKQEIAERKKAEEKLKESEEKYRLMVESSGDAIVINQNGKFIFYNDAFAKMLDYDMEDIESVNYKDIYTEKAINQLEERSRRRDNGEDVPNSYETIFKRKDGTEIDVEANVTIIDYKGQKATFAV
ncbi:MAG: tetratricopeptide repeat protein, partial [Candidatus Marinimicrobia bacterium]|nr:tetratricopeptide repeat protein [Candidatus Neomarinimicrobiota bacterium]